MFQQTIHIDITQIKKMRRINLLLAASAAVGNSTVPPFDTTKLLLEFRRAPHALPG